ncbi:Fur family transcriptional regulator [Flavicella sediminum]|uniref:Fur family transcriptional regulator n=1 Tax=Flavicella sediminum TaxID=2585141 RepID=UPI001407DF87|nr:transcriptional repressor [Flavicella sediminum]
MKNLLRLKKLNETPFRKRVLDIFNKYPYAISMGVIEKELKDYNRITLYRTMKAFVKNGLIHEILMGGEETKFALCKEICSNEAHQHQHIHFKCKQCNSVTCVEIAKFPVISLPNYKIEELEIQATGVCAACQS